MDADRWRRVEAVVDAVLAADEARRAAVLDEQCAGDDELRREVASLLAQHEQAALLLESPAWQDAAAALVSEDAIEEASTSGSEVTSPHLALPAGARLGPYEVVGRLGRGGMGEVYEARDTRLGRTVAIKVLPRDLAGDSERRRRFEHEARAVSALNHPHICTLYDIGEAGLPDRGSKGTGPGRVSYLVLEYLAGQTLDERIAKGPLPLAQVLDVGAQIAEALGAVHRHGIVHRDLKPANVMLTKANAPNGSDVHVKLLDFGLAKLRVHGERPLVAAAGPTASASLTARGEILGTWPYMAPEQVEGKAADGRTDIWALGAVLYEMVSGRRAFEGDTPTKVLAAILEHEPEPLATLQPATPPALARLITKCLAKDPDTRWQDARDLADELRWIDRADANVGTAVTQPGKVSRWRRSAYAMAALCVVGATAFVAWALGNAGRVRPEPRHGLMDTRPAEGLLGSNSVERMRGRPAHAMALSPDGRTLVFSGVSGELQQLYRRRLDEDTAVPIDGTEGGQAPFFSPDGRWIGYWARNAIWKVSAEGGAPVQLFRSAPIARASWSVKDTIATDAEGLMVTPAGGGASTIVLADGAVPGERSYRHPTFLPDGETVLFTARTSTMSGSVAVLSLRTGVRTPLIDDAMDPRYVEGYLLYVRRGRLEAVPFDARRLKVTGEPVVVIADVMQFLNSGSVLDTGCAQVAVSSEGTLVYVSGGIVPDPPGSLHWLDRQGRVVETLPLPPGNYSGPKLSPDGRRVVYVKSGPDWSLWNYDIARRTSDPIPTRGADPQYPMWFPDSQEVLYTDWVRLYRVRVDGRGEAAQIPTGSVYPSGTPWEYPGPPVPGGLTFMILVEPPVGETGASIYLLDLGRDPPARTLVLAPPATTRVINRRREGLMFPSVSPDGQWLTYGSDESGAFAVYVCRYPGFRDKVRISPTAGRAPVWRRDGRELFYLRQTPEPALMAVDVDTVAGTFGPARELFRLPAGFWWGTQAVPAYDVSQDGQRFLFARRFPEPAPPPPSEMHVVYNWFEELKAKVPTGWR